MMLPVALPMNRHTDGLSCRDEASPVVSAVLHIFREHLGFFLYLVAARHTA
jgi:hypothetical protein